MSGIQLIVDILTKVDETQSAMEARLTLDAMVEIACDFVHAFALDCDSEVTALRFSAQMTRRSGSS